MEVTIARTLACSGSGAEAGLVRASLAAARLQMCSRGRHEGAWSGDGDLADDEAIGHYFAEEGARTRTIGPGRAAAAPSSLVQTCDAPECWVFEQGPPALRGGPKVRRPGGGMGRFQAGEGRADGGAGLGPDHANRGGERTEEQGRGAEGAIPLF